jgi:carbamate kinase
MMAGGPEIRDVPRRLVVAVGGNAIHPAGIKGTGEEQVEIAARAGRTLLPLLKMDNELIITHGNGPGIGKMLMRQALARHRVVPMPMDICVANSQGGIAYVLMQAFENALRESGNPRHVVCLLTQVEVDPDDPAFADSAKPVGYFYTKEEAEALADEMDWVMREDSGRGWRQVVPSPVPRHVVDISLIDSVARRGSVVIAAGGGGIPVLRQPNGVRHGVEAVIDKDRTSALMANVLGIKDILILTGVRGVAINFGKPDQRELDVVTVSEIRRHLEDGQFPAGSMGPKVEAAIQFIEGGGRRAVIAHLDDCLAALKGEAGTSVVPDAH